MFLRFGYIVTMSFMVSFLVYFGNPDRAVLINAFNGPDAQTALTGAMTSLLYLVALLPFFFLGFWKAWKLGFLFLALAAFGPGAMAIHAVKSAERSATANDIAPASTILRVTSVDLIESKGQRAATCRQTCKALLRKTGIEIVRKLDATGTPVVAFALTANGAIVAAPVETPADLTIELFQDSDELLQAAWPEWIGGFAKPKTLTRLTIRDANAAPLLIRTRLAYDIAESPTWLHPPTGGLRPGDLRASIEVATRSEWHSAITPEAVLAALKEMGVSDETVVAQAR